MGKVNLLVKYRLINEELEYNIKGIFLNNELKFLDNNDVMILNTLNNTLKRIKKEEEILFDFNLQKCYVFDKISKNKLSLEMPVLKKEISSNKFYVKYKIETNLFEIMIKIK